MRSHYPQENNRHNLARQWLLGIVFSLLFSWGLFFLPLTCEARTAATPWSPEVTYQSLIYGASSTADVVRAVGAPPDEIVHSEQMFPVIENFYYYDENKTGAATVFIFENGLLVGMQLKTAGNQYVDLTYVLANNGDRALNMPLQGGYLPYYPYLPLTSW